MARIGILDTGMRHPFSVRRLIAALEADGHTIGWRKDVQEGEEAAALKSDIESVSCVLAVFENIADVALERRGLLDYGAEGHTLILVLLGDRKAPHRYQNIPVARLPGWDGDREIPAYQALLRRIDALAHPPAQSSQRYIERNRPPRVVIDRDEDFGELLDKGFGPRSAGAPSGAPPASAPETKSRGRVIGFRVFPLVMIAALIGIIVYGLLQPANQPDGGPSEERSDAQQ